MRFTRDQKVIITRAYRMNAVSIEELAAWAGTSSVNIRKAKMMGIGILLKQKRKQRK